MYNTFEHLTQQRYTMSIIQSRVLYNACIVRLNRPLDKSQKGVLLYNTYIGVCENKACGPVFMWFEVVTTFIKQNRVLVRVKNWLGG